MVKMELKSKKHYLIPIIGIIAIFILVIGGFWIVGTTSKANARHQVDDALSHINLSGQVVYSRVDETCSTNPSVGISIFGPSVEKCNYVGYKIYRNMGDSTEGVKQAGDVLKGLGFEPSRTSAVGKSDQIPYHNPAQPKLSASLDYVTGETKDSTASFGTSGEISFDGGYLYGVVIYYAQ